MRKRVLKLIIMALLVVVVELVWMNEAQCRSIDINLGWYPDDYISGEGTETNRLDKNYPGYHGFHAFSREWLQGRERNEEQETFPGENKEKEIFPENEPVDCAPWWEGYYEENKSKLNLEEYLNSREYNYRIRRITRGNMLGESYFDPVPYYNWNMKIEDFADLEDVGNLFLHKINGKYTFKWKKRVIWTTEDKKEDETSNLLAVLLNTYDVNASTLQNDGTTTTL